MPQYMTRKGNTYYFRQAVPKELVRIVGRREIKESLGRDYPAAVRACKRYAVTAQGIIDDARARLDSIPVDPYSREGIRRTKHVVVTRVTAELESQFGNLMRESILDSDKQARIAGFENKQAFDEYGQDINEALTVLRKRLAMGDVEPMRPSAHMFLVGRGYQPEFSEEDWRRIAYVMTQAALEAHEVMALRQKGAVPQPPTGDILVSQFEVQNAPQANSSCAYDVTWQDLYDVWFSECSRTENTRAAYLAAMKLFKSFSRKEPQAVTRDDVLAFRDFLSQEQGLAPGTVANKIGFVGTLVSSGRNSSKYAKYLPHNPFENVKVKRPKKGKAEGRRLPFNDKELALIFGSPIYTQGLRPRGGGGEAAAWIPAIAYLSGMRLEEIAVLKVSQFHVDASGNPYIHVEDGKNENSADRDVPIHPALVEAGLLDYVGTCTGRIFPRVRCSNEVQSKAYSQWYGRQLDKLGISGRSKVFHSFRHLFKDLCRNARIAEPIIDQICGHEPGTVGGSYGVGCRVDVLTGFLATVVPPVKIPKIFGKPERS